MAKRIVLSVYLALAGAIGFCQSPLEHEKKLYVSDEGKIFIQKSLPVYLKLATSPDEDAETVLLKSEQTTEYANPMYFDTEGYNSFHSPSAVDPETKKTVYPKQDVIFEVYADSKPPVTDIDYGDTKTYRKEGKILINSHTNISLEAKDQMSGTEAVYVSLDGKAFSKYTKPLVLKEEKEYVLKYYAVDNVGNVEKMHSLNLLVDGSFPRTTLKLEGDVHKNIISGRSKLSLSSDDNNGIKAIYYKIDDGNKQVYKGTLYARYLKEGAHSISYYAVDNTNNKEPENVDSFYVDKSPPIIIQDLVGNEYISGTGTGYSSGRSKLKLTAYDNKAGVKEIYYSVNGQEYKKYNDPFNLSIASGNINVKSYAIDNVNNKTSSSQQEKEVTNIPYIDLSGPELSYNFKGPVFKTKSSLYIGPNTKIVLKAKDEESGLHRIEYSLDDKDFQIYNEPFFISNEGKHKIAFKGFDNVNNINQNEFSLIIDTTGPKIFSQYSINPNNSIKEEGNNIKSFPKHMVLFLSSKDELSGFEKMYYSINNSSPKLYTDKINNFLSADKYHIQIKALDKLGNQSEKTVEFQITE